MFRTFDDLPQRIRHAIQDAMPIGVIEFGSFINSPWPVLGNRSVIQTLNEDGYDGETAIIKACGVMNQLREQAASHRTLLSSRKQ